MLICWLFSTIPPVQAQAENSNWQFGYHAGLNFTPTGPVPATNAFDSFEACTSVSDSLGNLLCYSEGASVFDRTHAVMPNGVVASGPTVVSGKSATQGALLVRQPGPGRRYYLFTVAAAENALVGGGHYSVVDMSLRGGLGDVLPTQKNVALAPGTLLAEKLTAVRHANGRDYWVLVHGWETNEFYAYLLSATGLAAAPVVSAVGVVHQGGSAGTTLFDAYANAFGYLRASPDGRRLAVAARGLPLQLFAFDNLTGRISAPQTLAVPQPGAALSYGLEFSPDNTKLYATTYDAGNSSFLSQFDLANNARAVLLYTPPASFLNRLGAIARGPDGRLYLAHDNGTALSVITNPNAAGLACGLQPLSVPLGTGQPGVLSQIGLPNFPNDDDPYRLNLNGATQGCAGSVLQFSQFLGAALTTSALSWNFGDPASGSANMAAGRDARHLYSTAGTYTVQLTATVSGGRTVVAAQQVVVNPVPVVNLGNRRPNLCPGQLLLLGTAPQPAGTSYRWQDGSTQPTLLLSRAGRYVLTVTSAAGCRAADSVEVTLLPRTTLGRDTVVCQGSLRLRPSPRLAGSRFYWQDGSTDSVFVATQSGDYIVQVQTPSGCTVSAQRYVKFVDCANLLPNIITPNGDGLNQAFVLKGLNAANWSVRIYNRWGREILVQEKYDNSWAAQNQPDGLYYYLLTNPRTGQKLKGWVEVLR